MSDKSLTSKFFDFKGLRNKTLIAKIVKTLRKHEKTYTKDLRKISNLRQD